MAEFIIGDYLYTTLDNNDNNDVRARTVDKTKTTYHDIPSQVTYDAVTYNVISMSYCFRDCTSLTTTPVIPDNVTNMDSCFSGCTSLTTPPTIPNSVTDVGYCFSGCTSLTTAPIIPSSVTDMHRCFENCTSLTTPPTIPNSVVDMQFCFYNCTSLTIAPMIPSSVVDMRYCFGGCTSLTIAPIIQNGVIDMDFCFYGCTSLTTAPIIPDSVKYIGSCFSRCTSLVGDVYIRSSTILRRTYLFSGVNNQIILHTYANNAQEMASTGTNVIVGDAIQPTILATQRVDSKRYRVDMLLDCKNSGSIVGMVPNGTLYDMNDDEIEVGIGNNTPPPTLRCYAIIETNNQVPNNNISITVQNVAPSSKPKIIGTPCTATPSALRKKQEDRVISSTMNTDSIRFDPKATGLTLYTLREFLNFVGESEGYNSSYKSVQVNHKESSQANVDIKHFVTHASNVKLSNGTTLQRWITEKYNEV